MVLKSNKYEIIIISSQTTFKTKNKLSLSNCFILAKTALYDELFGCGQSQFSISYFLIIIHYRRVKNAERKHVKERVQKRLSG
jgi:hypothetical protein